MRTYNPVLADPARSPVLRLGYSVNETCGLTGWSRAKLYNLMKDGTLPFVKIGGTRLVLDEDLKNLLRANRSQ